MGRRPHRHRPSLIADSPSPIAHSAPALLQSANSMSGGRAIAHPSSCRRGPVFGRRGVALVAWSAAHTIDAAPIVRGAQVHVVLTSPTACDIDATFTIQTDRPAAVPFSLQTFEGARVELTSLNGLAVPAGDLQRSGRTTVFAVHLSGSGNETTALRYRVAQAPDWAYRCPIWLPAVPTDGRPGAVRLQFEWPTGASLTGRTLPPLSRSGTGGASSLSHVPAFVRVPFVVTGGSQLARRDWDLTAIMDAATLVALLAASLVWVAARGRRRGRAPDGARGTY